jgi:hypothetical protein
MLIDQHLQTTSVVGTLLELGLMLTVTGLEVLGAADVEALVNTALDSVNAGASGGGGGLFFSQFF